jgi:hypothetical protein
MSRYHILQTIKDALDGLVVNVQDDPRTLSVVDTLVDPTQESSLPVLTITPGPETASSGLNGYAPLACTLRIDLYGYIDGGSVRIEEDKRNSRLAKAAEDLVRAIKKKLTDPLFIDAIQCEFSILQIGPYIVEHAELEEPFAYISMPLTVEYIDDVQTDMQD